MEQFPIEARDGSYCCLAQAKRTLDDRLKYWLSIGWGLRDHPQDLAGGRLLLERLGEVGVLGLQLGEQPRVLDGDGRLVGEGLGQRDLAVAERSHFVPVDEDDAEELGRAEHRDRENGSGGIDLDNY